MNSNFENQKLESVYNLLKIVFVVVPIVAGLDKFTNLLVSWDMYINPLLLKILPVNGHTFMYVVGVIEIAAGAIVFAQPRIGAYIVSAWLVCIALSLLTSGHFLDVAVRDLVMSVGAFSLARISVLVDEKQRSKNNILASAYNK